jgi:acylphosphatase
MNFRFRVIVQGKVQGVFFRKTTTEKAQKLGLSGWVKNEGHDKVIFECQGFMEMCFQLISWAQSGPPMAEVESLKLEQLEPQQGESGFETMR